MPHFLREAQGVVPTIPTQFHAVELEWDRTALDTESLGWHEELPKICHNLQERCTGVERGPNASEGVSRRKQGSKESVEQ